MTSRENSPIELDEIDRACRDAGHNPCHTARRGKGSEVETRRVLILCEPGLFAQGLRSLLESDGGLEIVGVIDDVTRAADAIRDTQPLVLLVQEDKFPPCLGPAPNVLPLAQIARLVTLCPNENKIRIYRVEEHPLTAPKDLIDALLV